MPANAGAFELLRFLLGEQVEVGERVLERYVPELAEGRLGGPEVALLDRAGEASVCRPLTRHRRWGRRCDYRRSGERTLAQSCVLSPESGVGRATPVAAEAPRNYAGLVAIWRILCPVENVCGSQWQPG